MCIELPVVIVLGLCEFLSFNRSENFVTGKIVIFLGNRKKHVLKSKMTRIKCILRSNAFFVGIPVLHPTFMNPEKIVLRS